jgi:hypothetical protein
MGGWWMQRVIKSSDQKRKTNLAVYRNIFGLHIIPQGFAAFLAAIARLAIAAKGCFDAACMPLIDKHLSGAQPGSGPCGTVQIAREDTGHQTIIC